MSTLFKIFWRVHNFFPKSGSPTRVKGEVIPTKAENAYYYFPEYENEKLTILRVTPDCLHMPFLHSQHCLIFQNPEAETLSERRKKMSLSVSPNLSLATGPVKAAKPALPAKPAHIRPGLKPVKIPTVDDKVLGSFRLKVPIATLNQTLGPVHSVIIS